MFLDDYDLDKDIKKQKEAKESSEGSGSEPDEEFDSEGSDVSDIIVEEARKNAKKQAQSSKDKSPSNDKASTSKPDVGKKRHESTTKKAVGGKKKKDPNAPKRNQTSFFLWQTENRASIKKSGDSVTDTASRAGQIWKAMSEEEKKVKQLQKALLHKSLFVFSALRTQSEAGQASLRTRTAGVQGEWRRRFRRQFDGGSSHNNNNKSDETSAVDDDARVESVAEQKGHFAGIC